jgi:hypothetical protein
MTTSFPTAYPDYRAKTRMLIPCSEAAAHPRDVTDGARRAPSAPGRSRTVRRAAL